MIKFKSVDWPGLDLTEIEKLRKWIEYNPKCYVEKLKSGELEEQKLEDDLTLFKIKKLYDLIKKIDGKLNVKQQYFNLENPKSTEEENEYIELINSIPELNISYYASIKLTNEERQFAYEFLKQCNEENSKEMMEYAKNYSNFFVGSYMEELLIHHPKSNYINSSKVIRTKNAIRNEKLSKRFRKIEIREQKAYEYAQYRG